MPDPNAPEPESRRRRAATKPPLLATPLPNQRALVDERARLDEDLIALRETEANLRAYEARLRTLQAEFDAARRAGTATRAPRATRAPVRAKAVTPAPFAGNHPGLQAEWDKVIRARELLEHEQAHLRGDRLALRDEAAVVRRRADALDQREARLAERERAVQAAEAASPTGEIPGAATAAGDTPPHLLSKLTMAPFAMGCSLLGRPKRKA